MTARHPLPDTALAARRALKSAKPSLLALEARLMFDGAAAATEPAHAPEPAAAGDAPAGSNDLAASNTAIEAPVGNPPRTIAFVDTRVTDWQSLVAQLPPEVEVVTLDPARDELSQIASALDGRHDIAALHLISHGESGTLILGGQKITSATLAARQTDLAAIGRALGTDGDILLYGCDIGQGSTGQAFIDAIANATAADVAASTDVTGAAALGGNWTLEAKRGQVETAAFAPEGYGYSLDAPTGEATALLPEGIEDTPYLVQAADLLSGFSDADSGDILSVSALAADHGSVTDNGDGTYTITPEENYNGLVSLSYEVADGNGGSVAATQSFTLLASNEAPIGTATAVLAEGSEDTGYIVQAANLLSGFSDIDSEDILSVSALAADHGSVADNGDGTYTITPEENYNGVVSLSYEVVDGNGGSVAATQSFTLLPANDAPTGSATGTLAAGTKNTAYLVHAADLLSGFSDVDGGDVLSVSALSTDHGSVADNGDGSYTITPEGEYTGVINLHYEVLDGNGGGIAATQSLTLLPPNDTANNPATGVPTISGMLVENQALTADTSGIGDADGLGTFHYQWQRDGVDIGEATNSTYALTNADVDKRITVVVSYSDGQGRHESISSAVSDAVANINDMPAGSLLIRGVAAQGQTLTVNDNIIDADGLGIVTYHWLRDGVDTGTTGAHYVLAATDIGATISVRGTYTDGHGTAESLASAATGAVGEAVEVPTVILSPAKLPMQLISSADQDAGRTALPAEVFTESSPPRSVAQGYAIDAPDGRHSISASLLGSGISSSPAAPFDPTAGALSSPLPERATGNDTPLLIMVLPGDRPALVNYRGIPDVSAGEPGQHFAFQIPATAFAQSGSAAAVTFSARLADGRPLPASLHFNPVSGRFEGTLPDRMKGDMAIKVVARDAQGREANAVFHIRTGNEGESRPGNERGRPGLSQQLRSGRAPAR